MASMEDLTPMTLQISSCNSAEEAVDSDSGLVAPVMRMASSFEMTFVSRCWYITGRMQLSLYHCCTLTRVFAMSLQ